MPTLKETEEAVASVRQTIASIDANIKWLESYFAVSCIDAWPYVVVLESDNMAHTAALKSLGDNRYNFSAQGRDATQYGRKDAETMAAHMNEHDHMGRKCYAEGKYHYFKRVLESDKRSKASLEQMLIDAGH